MLEGVEVIEVEDSAFETFDEAGAAANTDGMSEKLQFVRRELFEIRDLLGSVH